jgi:nicotinamidase/pyrazinamidase
VNALILVDIQNDFLPGGALAVRGGDEILPLLNQLQPRFDIVVAAQDWHPRDHGSFAANHPGKSAGDLIDLHGLPQRLWPVHCVQGTPGADFSSALDRSRWAKIFAKGTDATIDSYSGFFDNGRRNATGLGDYLRERGVTEVYVAGLATDYCVKFTALDAVQLGFRTYVIEDACRAVNLQSEDAARAYGEMRAAGVHVIRAADLFTLNHTPS